MTASAVHRVVVNGPEDDLLFRLLVIVADWPETDIGDAGYPISQRLVATRLNRSLWYTRTLMTQAATAGWLVQKPGGRRRMSLWKIGPNCAGLRVTTAHPARGPRSESRTTARGTVLSARTDVDVSGRKRAHPPAGGGGGAAHETSVVPPGRPPPVENNPYAHFPNWTAERLEREKGV